MSEPLTDEQLDELAELWIGKIAAAEISTLRDKCKGLNMQLAVRETCNGDWQTAEKLVRELLDGFFAAGKKTAEAENAKLREKMSQMIELVNTRWSFDQHQQHTHSWHDKQDALEEIRDLAKTPSSE